MGYYIETNGPKGKAKWLVDKLVITRINGANAGTLVP